MGVPVYFYTWVDSQADAGKLTAARLNGDFAPLYACLDPATGGLEDTNVKAGAKIVCTDRAHTVTGVWTFTTAPVLPAASIADASLSTNIMKRSVYDADLDGVVDSAANADTVDGSHAVAFAAAAHNHNLNDLTEKSYNSLTDKPITGYALSLVAAMLATVADGVTYYFGGIVLAPITAEGYARVYIPKAGSIKSACVWMYPGTPPTTETISVYIRKNGTTDTLIETAACPEEGVLFDNAGLSIAMSVGDYFEIKVVCPTFATNPASVYFSGSVYIE